MGCLLLAGGRHLSRSRRQQAGTCHAQVPTVVPAVWQPKSAESAKQCIFQNLHRSIVRVCDSTVLAEICGVLPVLIGLPDACHLANAADIWQPLCSSKDGTVTWQMFIKSWLLSMLSCKAATTSLQRITQRCSESVPQLRQRQTSTSIRMLCSSASAT